MSDDVLTEVATRVRVAAANERWAQGEYDRLCGERAAASDQLDAAREAVDEARRELFRVAAE